MGTFTKRQPRLINAVRESKIPRHVLAREVSNILWEQIAVRCGTAEEWAIDGFRAQWDRCAASAFNRIIKEGRRLRRETLLRYFMEAHQAEFARAKRVAQ